MIKFKKNMNLIFAVWNFEPTIFLGCMNQYILLCRSAFWINLYLKELEENRSINSDTNLKIFNYWEVLLKKEHIKWVLAK